MTEHQIICTTQIPVDEPTTHAHIVAVGTGEPGAAPTRRWTLEEVIAAIEEGDAFYTEDDDGNRAEVEVVACPACDHQIIRTVADDSTGNNLDSLPICPADTASASTTASGVSTGRTGNAPATPRLPPGRNVG